MLLCLSIVGRIVIFLALAVGLLALYSVTSIDSLTIKLRSRSQN